MKRLQVALKQERMRYRIFPEPEDVFKAFQLTDFDNVHIVILGQDPYPTYGHAHGLAFSYAEQLGDKLPKSLANIFKEVETDIGFSLDIDANLTRWAEQGVLLLNTILTVREGQPLSHANIGWEKFTGEVVKLIGKKEEPVVFMLWGANAQKYHVLAGPKHHVIMTPHPSPLSAYRGFFGSRCFSRANDFLRINKNIEINWI